MSFHKCICLCHPCHNYDIESFQSLQNSLSFDPVTFSPDYASHRSADVLSVFSFVFHVEKCLVILNLFTIDVRD